MGRRFVKIIVFAVITAAFSRFAEAAPVVLQSLDNRRSKLAFAIDSNRTSVSGSFADLSGKLLTGEKGFPASTLELSLDLESVQFPSDQLLPSIIFQSVLARLREKRATFRSTEIVPIDSRKFKVRGLYRWQGKERSTEAPVTLVSSSSQGTELRCSISRALSGDDTAPALQSVVGTSGKASADSTLVFRAVAGRS